MELLMATKNYDNEWQIFFSKVETYAADPEEKWTPLTFLSYFLLKYKQITGVDYVFTYTKKGPTNSKEMKDAGRIWAIFDKGRLQQINNKADKIEYRKQLVAILKKYIDWAFDVKMKNKSITGLGLFTNARFVNEFLQWRTKNKQTLPKRSDPLPKDFIEWIKINAAEVLKKQQLSTLEDLNILYNYIEAYDPNHVSVEYKTIQKARELNIMPANGKIKLEKK